MRIGLEISELMIDEDKIEKKIMTAIPNFTVDYHLYYLMNILTNYVWLFHSLQEQGIHVFGASSYSIARKTADCCLHQYTQWKEIKYI